MPVLTLKCPQCAHEFKEMTFSGAKLPDVWICGACGSDKANLKPGTAMQPHPWDAATETDGNGRSVRLRHPSSCPCCF